MLKEIVGQCSPVQDSTGQCSTVQDSTGQYSTGQYRTVQDSTGQYRTVQESAGYCKTEGREDALNCRAHYNFGEPCLALRISNISLR